MNVQLVLQILSILFNLTAIIFLCKSIRNMKKSEKILKEQLKRYNHDDE